MEIFFKIFNNKKKICVRTHTKRPLISFYLDYLIVFLTVCLSIGQPLSLDSLLLVIHYKTLKTIIHHCDLPVFLRHFAHVSEKLTDDFDVNISLTDLEICVLWSFGWRKLSKLSEDSAEYFFSLHSMFGRNWVTER